ncbi:MAG: S-layer homology domain-containing protein [Ruminococcus sp.]|nr:S-layer homology domain-containing protein [Candidatus Apopatosoma intestinale]
MKNFKRILALVLTLMFIVGSCASLSAFSGSTTTSWYAAAVSWIENTGVDTIGSTAGDKIDRETFVKWVAKIESTYVDDYLWDDEVASTSFADVTEENYRAAIAYSQQRGFIRGYDASTFGPKDTLTFAQACAVIVRVLGCESWVEDQSAANWEYNYINIANKLEAIDSVWVGNVGFYVPAHEMTKGEAAYLLYKASKNGAGHDVLKDGETKVIGKFGNLATKTVGELVLITKLDCKTTVVAGANDAKYAEVVMEGTGKKYGEDGAANLMRYTDGSAYVNASTLGIFENPEMTDFWAKKNYQAYFNRTAYTADLDLDKKVEFLIFDTATQSFKDKGSMTAKEFQQLVRVGSGLPKDVGVTETYSIFNTVRVGSVVNLVRKTKQTANISPLRPLVSTL